MSNEDPASSDRARQAAKILESPQQYKVCAGCGSIVTARTTSCPSCHAYQFDEGEERVVAQATSLAKRGANAVLSSDLT
jgi:RNA polymerase subunit RPABC4/transcription elongation factor Spt4